MTFNSDCGPKPKPYVLFLFLFCFLILGCLQYDEVLELEHDQSGTMTITISTDYKFVKEQLLAEDLQMQSEAVKGIRIDSLVIDSSENSLRVSQTIHFRHLKNLSEYLSELDTSLLATFSLEETDEYYAITRTPSETMFQKSGGLDGGLGGSLGEGLGEGFPDPAVGSEPDDAADAVTQALLEGMMGMMPTATFNVAAKQHMFGRNITSISTVDGKDVLSKKMKLEGEAPFTVYVMKKKPPLKKSALGCYTLVYPKKLAQDSLDRLSANREVLWGTVQEYDFLTAPNGTIDEKNFRLTLVKLSIKADRDIRYGQLIEGCPAFNIAKGDRIPMLRNSDGTLEVILDYANFLGNPLQNNKGKLAVR